LTVAFARLRNGRTIDGVTESDPILPSSAPDGGAPARRPAAICHGSGHIVKSGNPAFVAAFGAQCVGLPARECLLGLPPDAFVLLDVVLAKGRPFSRWIRLGKEEWRMTAVPRVDPGTHEVYGVAFHLRSLYDLPVLASGSGDE
jgi:hypothetical protein